MSLQLALRQLANDRNARIIMTHDGDGGNYVGIRQEEFHLGGAAEYSNPFESHLQDTQARLGAAVTAAANSTAGQFVAQRLNIQDVVIPNLTWQQNSLQQWVSSQRPQIPVSFTLIRYDESQEPVHLAVAQLISLCYPRNPNGARYSESNLVSPGGYNPLNGNSGQATGVWTVSVGQFFRADQLLLMSAEGVCSKESGPDGSPIYASVSCVFSPTMIPTQEDIRAWFNAS